MNLGETGNNTAATRQERIFKGKPWKRHYDTHIRMGLSAHEKKKKKKLEQSKPRVGASWISRV